jgi:hypothetical protein
VLPTVERFMKTLAALAVVGLLAGAGVLWFLSNPVVVTATVKPLQPSAAIPTFHPVAVPLRPSN